MYANVVSSRPYLLDESRRNNIIFWNDNDRNGATARIYYVIVY